MPDLSVEQIVEALGNMTISQIIELTKALETKWGVSAAAPVMVGTMAAPGATGAAAAAAEQAEEQTEFDVILATVGDKKIQVIKEIRTITGLGLKEAKDAVEGAPYTIKQGASKEEVEKIKAQLEAVGATVEIK